MGGILAEAGMTRAVGATTGQMDRYQISMTFQRDKYSSIHRASR